MTKKNQQSLELAGRSYRPDDYNKEDQLSSGLAHTHEQVSDTLTEGTIDGKIENVNGKDIPLSKDGYNK
ncbi:YozQ family protein [Cytobacillus gottheilii]|uniref:YozQ family protein n=1 Tax=Cytobacillus gottheilii TaxID=859144 RepID=UPI0009B96E84|nr:YozQ family protein [Cytobacillus gottheilii]